MQVIWLSERCISGMTMRIEYDFPCIFEHWLFSLNFKVTPARVFVNMTRKHVILNIRLQSRGWHWMSKSFLVYVTEKLRVRTAYVQHTSANKGLWFRHLHNFRTEISTLLLLASSLKIGDSIRHEDTSCGYSQFTLVLKKHKMFEACSNIKIERSVVMFPPQELPHGLATSVGSTAGTRI